MNRNKITKITLPEIKDYRGNLSFAEEENPIPFDIKSVFWGTIDEGKTLQIPAQYFIIALDGSITIKSSNSIELNRPCQACNINSSTEIIIKPITKESIILIAMNEAIIQEDANTEDKNGLLTMPRLNNFHGLDGYFANSNTTLPFDIKRIYFTYNIPAFAKRGGHAHKKLTSVIFAAKGSFDVILDDNKTKEKQNLDTPNRGLYIKDGLWREIENFTKKSLVLVLASDKYDAKDYIRSYKKFKK